VDLWGGFNREVRIELEPDRIKALGLPFSEVIDAFRNANMDLRRRLAGQIPGMKIVTRAPQGQFLLGEQDGLTVETRGFGLQTLELLATRVSQAIFDVPGITDVSVSRKAGVPQFWPSELTQASMWL
jgi:Cu/Ag efflux pump CusA